MRGIGARLPALLNLLGFLALMGLQGCSEPPGSADRGAGSAEEGGGGQSPLLVLAAADLQAAFDTLVPLFSARSGERVDVMLGSTGNLAAQIRHGAPADLFFAANAPFLDDLVEAGLVDAASRRPYAVGRLALVAPPDSPLPDDLEALANERFAVVAIANPEHAPYGIAAREALTTAGIWTDISNRLVLGETVAQAWQFVQTGNADAGLVALALVMADPTVRWSLVDEALHAPLIQVAGVLEASERPDRALAFLDFVTSDEGRDILRRFGFERPPDAGSQRPRPRPGSPLSEGG